VHIVKNVYNFIISKERGWLSMTNTLPWRLISGHADPAAYWELLEEDQKMQIAQAQLDMKISYLKEQVNQLNKEIEMHQMALDMIKKKK